MFKDCILLKNIEEFQIKKKMNNKKVNKKDNKKDNKKNKKFSKNVKCIHSSFSR